MHLSLGQIIAVINGKASGVNLEAEVRDISTDSRTITEGSLFIALSGDNFDGKDYAQAALDKGGVAVVVEDPSGLPVNKIIIVDDSRQALLSIAGFHRQFAHAKLIAITGSVGKTTTKEMVALMLEGVGKTLKTRANLNNEVGLSQMIMELDDSYDYAVLELGVDGVGQMLSMARATQSDVAVVTNIGQSHLEAFGSCENIKKEKLDIVKGLKGKGRLVLNGDDPMLWGLTTEKPPLFYAVENKEADITAHQIEVGKESTKFVVTFEEKSYNVVLPVAGNHNVLNALAALAVMTVLDIPLAPAVAALAGYKAEGMRQKFVEFSGYTVVEDCYNASPQSVAAAIATLTSLPTSGRRIFIFSDMLELGGEEKSLHSAVGQLVGEAKLDIFLATGILSLEAVEAAAKTGIDARYYSTKTQLAQELKAIAKPGDILWFKASRGMKLEEVISEIYKGE